MTIFQAAKHRYLHSRIHGSQVLYNAKVVDNRDEYYLLNCLATKVFESWKTRFELVPHREHEWLIHNDSSDCRICVPLVESGNAVFDSGVFDRLPHFTVRCVESLLNDLHESDLEILFPVVHCRTSLAK